MANLDSPSDPLERGNTIHALRAAEGKLPERVRQMRVLFAWGQSRGFYEGLFRGLVTAAELLRNNPEVDRNTLSGLLLIEAGIVAEHLAGDESPDGDTAG
jgi:hypothetical protein